MNVNSITARANDTCDLIVVLVNLTNNNDNNGGDRDRNIDNIVQEEHGEAGEFRAAGKRAKQVVNPIENVHDNSHSGNSAVTCNYVGLGNSALGANQDNNNRIVIRITTRIVMLTVMIRCTNKCWILVLFKYQNDWLGGYIREDRLSDVDHEENEKEKEKENNKTKTQTNKNRNDE